MVWFGKIRAYFMRYTQAVATTGIVSVAGTWFYSQTLGLQQYKRWMAHYKDGVESPVDSETLQLIEKVIHRMDLSIDDEARLNFFTSWSWDPERRGSLQLRTGVQIGLPFTFSYQSVDDVDHSSIVIGNEKVDWDSPAAEELQNSLVLSDKAKAFVIAREISYAQLFSVHVESVLQCVCLTMSYYSGQWLNRRMLLTLRLKLWARFLAFSTVGVAWLALYIVLSDASRCWQDNRADRAAANLRKIYAEGGVEYYERLLQRNSTFRTLLGSRGNKMFTRYGNIVSLWRNRGVQFTSRYDSLVKYLAEYEHEEHKETMVTPDEASVEA